MGNRMLPAKLVLITDHTLHLSNGTLTRRRDSCEIGSEMMRGMIRWRRR